MNFATVFPSYLTSCFLQLLRNTFLNFTFHLRFCLFKFSLLFLYYVSSITSFNNTLPQFILLVSLHPPTPPLFPLLSLPLPLSWCNPPPPFTELGWGKNGKGGGWNKKLGRGWLKWRMGRNRCSSH